MFNVGLNYLSETVDKAQKDQKLMPEMNPSGSQEMNSAYHGTLKGKKI